MGKTIIVTGCAGFIGSHLTEKLINDGHVVIGIDNLQTGSEKNMAVFKNNSSFEFLRHDVVEPVAINEAVDQIYHLACPAAPVHYQKDPIKTLNTAFIGTKNLLELARAQKARILITSTSEVYGVPLEHPQHESYWGNVNPIGPRSCYDEGKRAGESLAFAYHNQQGVDIKIVRVFNTYGPHMAQNDGRVMPNFILQALNSQPLTIYGTGDQTRSFCYVSDMIDALLTMMAKPDFTGPVNLGNPAEITMKSLAETIIELTNSTSKFDYRPLPTDDPHQRQPDITLAKKELGWEPLVSLEEGLQRTIEYFRKIS